MHPTPARIRDAVVVAFLGVSAAAGIYHTARGIVSLYTSAYNRRYPRKR